MHYSKTSEKREEQVLPDQAPRLCRAREGKHLLPPRLPPGLQLAWAPALGSTQNPPEPTRTRSMELASRWPWEGGSDLALSSGPPFPAGVQMDSLCPARDTKPLHEK